MDKDKLSFYSNLTVAALGAILLIYISVKYVFLVALPFLIAWAVAFSVRGIATRISGATKIPYKIISVTLTLIITIGSIAVIVSACIYAMSEAWEFLTGLAESDSLYTILDKIMNPIRGIFGEHDGATELEAHISSAISSMISSLLSGLVGVLTAFVSSVPRVIIFVLVTVTASVYFSLDLKNINNYVMSHLPSKIGKWLSSFKNRFLSSMLKYIRAYLIIMLITFITVLFGFLILGVKYSVLLAFIVALLDALPLIGVGTVLVPWSIYQLVFGEVRLAIGLAVLFALHEILRQLIEPKIIGKSLGIHPILSLILLYIGYCFFGFFGLLLIPLASVIVNSLINKDDSSEVNEGLVGK